MKNIQFTPASLPLPGIRFNHDLKSYREEEEEYENQDRELPEQDRISDEDYEEAWMKLMNQGVWELVIFSILKCYKTFSSYSLTEFMN